MRLPRSAVLALLCASLVACASPPPPPRHSLYVDGVRQIPVDEKEVERAVWDQAEALGACYRRERLNAGLSSSLSGYVFRMRIGVDGARPSVALVRESVGGQVALRECLEQVLKRLDFPAHVGQPLVVDVPIKEAGGA